VASPFLPGVDTCTGKERLLDYCISISHCKIFNSAGESTRNDYHMEGLDSNPPHRNIGVAGNERTKSPFL
jgi:hypothetical protein